MGTVRIASEAYPDPRNAELVVVDVEPITALNKPLPIADLRTDKVLAELGFVKMPRVAVQPVTPAQWDRVMQVSGTDLEASLGLGPADMGGP